MAKVPDKVLKRVEKSRETTRCYREVQKCLIQLPGYSQAREGEKGGGGKKSPSEINNGRNKKSVITGDKQGT